MGRILTHHYKPSLCSNCYKPGVTAVHPNPSILCPSCQSQADAWDSMSPEKQELEWLYNTGQLEVHFPPITEENIPHYINLIPKES